AQKVVEPAAVTVGVAGGVPIVTTTSSEAEQLLEPVTVTEYVPAVVADNVCDVAPGMAVPFRLQAYVAPALPASNTIGVVPHWVISAPKFTTGVGFTVATTGT